MTGTETELRREIAMLKGAIREIAHDMNNHLGVLRTATYLIEAAPHNEAKRTHYVSLINASVDKLEAGLKQLRALRENPQSDCAPPTPKQL